MKLLKIVVYVPEKSADKIRKVLAEYGAGHIGNYDYCSFSVKGIGRFRPLEGAKPSIGEKGRIEEVKEERIETIVPEDKIEKLLKELINVHPYEEPAIDIYPLLNDKYLT
jgi:hypothetical protein